MPNDYPYPLGAYARAYAHRFGWFVFPLVPRDKKPLTAHGVHDATNDDTTIRAWWDREPGANIGLNCGLSGVVVIDLDGAEAIDQWNLIIDSIGLPEMVRAAVAQTGKGNHLVYRAPGGVEIRNSAGKLGKGIDVRGAGGYIVLAPSIHPNGNAYEWINGYAPGDGYDELPEAIAKRLIEPPARPPAPVPASQFSHRTLQRTYERVAAAPEGTRNHTLNKAAFYLGGLIANGQLSETDARDVLLNAGLRAGLVEREITPVIRSAFNAARGA